VSEKKIHHQQLANRKGHRIPADDLYKFGEVGDIIRIYYDEHYLNAPVVKIDGNTRYIDAGDKLYIQEWDQKRWKNIGLEDKPSE
jgi:hypothetical protein